MEKKRSLCVLQRWDKVKKFLYTHQAVSLIGMGRTVSTTNESKPFIRLRAYDAALRKL